MIARPPVDEPWAKGIFRSMVATDIKNLLRASPSKPFAVMGAAGRSYHIPHPDYAWVSPDGATLALADDEGSAGIFLDVHLISEVHLKRPARPIKSRR